jgi:hypothetical protein
MPDVCANVGTLLMDSRTSVKNLAITCLVSLYDVFGESMLEELMQNSDIKASQIQAVKDAISYKNTHSDTLYLPTDNQNQNQNHHAGNFTVNDTVNHTKYGQESTLGDASKVKDDAREDASTVSAELASIQSNGSTIPVPVSDRPGLAGMSRTRDLSAPKRNPSNRLALTSTYMHALYVQYCLYFVVCVCIKVFFPLTYLSTFTIILAPVPCRILKAAILIFFT